MKKFKFEPQSLLYLIATYLSSLILAYFLEEFVRFSALLELKFFAERINVDNPLVWDITYEICFLFAYIIFHIVFSIAYKSRRKKFIKDTKGLITKKDGLIYHIKHYYVTDIVIIVLQAVAFMVLFLIKSSLCPMAIIYRICGVPLGIVASTIFLIAIHISHVLCAQYNWRVSHYMHE